MGEFVVFRVLVFARTEKRMDCGAGVISQKDVVDDLVADGHSLIPTQWTETDKNAP